MLVNNVMITYLNHYFTLHVFLSVCLSIHLYIGNTFINFSSHSRRGLITVLLQLVCTNKNQGCQINFETNFEVNLEVSASRLHPRYSNAHNCLGMTLGR